MKNIAYIIFAIVYHIACILPIKKNKCFCVMTHDGSDDSSVGVVVKAIKQKCKDATFVYMKKEDREISSLLTLIFKKSIDLATSQYVLMDNEFLPLAYVRRRNGVRVVQLWHGTGTIKKFGQDANTGKMLELEKKADNKITDLIVNSDYTKKLYKNAFGVADDVVKVTGIPRTDKLFDKHEKELCIESFFNEYEQLKGKKLVLYAPTFRDSEAKNPRCMLDLDTWMRAMDDETVLLIRLHPHVAAFYKNDTISKYNGKVVNVSDYPDVNTLLFVSEALITDYSSIIFEYIVLDKPMYYYAYDLDEFSDEEKDRGFYEDYERYVPGKVVRTTEELIKALNEPDDFHGKRMEFVDHAYRYKDGNSTERVLSLLNFGGTYETIT